MAELRTYPLGAGELTTRVIEAGDPDGPSVVFLHGMGARADRWLLNLHPVADAGFRALALDFPGHGFATKGAVPEYSVGGFAGFLLDALGALGIGEATLVGTSLGANVAGEVACREPARVRSLVLVGALGLLPVGPELAAAMAGSLGRQTREAIAEKLRFVVGDQSIVTGSWIVEESMVNSSPGAQDGLGRLAEYVVSRLDDDLVGTRLAAVDPALSVQLVWGAIDRPVPLEIGQQASVRYGWPLRVIEGAGHVVYRERPEEFNRVLLGFLAEP
jgi:pimeloyl-ACP methyl ester carboxylesterase